MLYYKNGNQEQFLLDGTSHFLENGNHLLVRWLKTFHEVAVLRI
ncbi:hypothetical protein T05_15235 [Trichinella murrelli]|uniref:Uncharacterized protein n=1 Tax=Trichinella murrelli TaxID=144512 RepID=A0A0V0UH40_9BILA|nr:hypothetical protein T05_15235 [Trichinella murrelli]